MGGKLFRNHINFHHAHDDHLVSQAVRFYFHSDT
jgi:hypothetical protein